jgi:hypothetical protein
VTLEVSRIDDLIDVRLDGTSFLKLLRYYKHKKKQDSISHSKANVALAQGFFQHKEQTMSRLMLSCR